MLNTITKSPLGKNSLQRAVSYFPTFHFITLGRPNHPRSAATKLKTAAESRQLRLVARSGRQREVRRDRRLEQGDGRCRRLRGVVVGCRYSARHDLRDHGHDATLPSPQRLHLTADVTSRA